MAGRATFAKTTDTPSSPQERVCGNGERMGWGVVAVAVMVGEVKVIWARE